MPRAPTIVAVEGDITAEAVDAIVNAANESLVRGGGGNGEAEVLASCYRRSLQVADELFDARALGLYEEALRQR